MERIPASEFHHRFAWEDWPAIETHTYMDSNTVISHVGLGMHIRLFFMYTVIVFDLSLRHFVALDVYVVTS